MRGIEGVAPTRWVHSVAAIDPVTDRKPGDRLQGAKRVNLPAKRASRLTGVTALLGAALLAGCGTGAISNPPSAAANPLDYTGVNFWAGTGNEQFVHGGVYGVDYGYDVDSIRYFRESGMNVIRLHLRWEVVQKVLMAPLDAGELGHLDGFVEAATAAGAVVILAVRDGARYQFANAANAADGEPQLIGSPRVPVPAFADLWQRLATHYADNQNVWFNLMNEPHDMATRQWVEAANEAILSIRDAGAKNRILVPGNNWSHGFGWAEPGGATDGVANSVAMLDIVDPADNTWLDIHEYVNGSGPENDCVSRTAYSQALADVSAWLKEHHRQAFLGEFGTGPGDVCLAAIEDLLVLLERERAVWRGWAYFSAARGLEHKAMSIKPIKTGESESPQMVVLKRHMVSGR